MARKTQVRVVVNRKALTAMEAGLVDTLEVLGERFVQTVHPPDATPFGEGLVTTPDWGVWANGRKVAGTAPKPRAERMRKGLIALLMGEGFPGRFQETGTVKQAPNPHVTPAALGVIDDLEGVARDKASLRSVR